MNNTVGITRSSSGYFD